MFTPNSDIYVFQNQSLLVCYIHLCVLYYDIHVVYFDLYDELLEIIIIIDNITISQ